MSQVVQFSLPRALLNFPFSQAEQVIDPLYDENPAPHDEHSLSGVSLPIYPAGQAFEAPRKNGFCTLKHTRQTEAPFEPQWSLL